MKVEIKCPGQAYLNALLDGTLPSEDSERVTEHLNHCSICQDSLEEFAKGDIPIDELVSDLDDSRPLKDSAYWPAITQVAEELVSARGNDTKKDGPQLNQDTVNDASDPELRFLDAPDDPAYIGKLQHFQISRVIGRGGMGIVLEAFDTHLQRHVAIKILNPKFQENDIARQRFCREGRAAAAINHEHVVAMHHVAKANEGEIAYLVMQYIEGITLEELLANRRPLPPDEVARISMQTAAGLSAAHARDMVHRDIKPANILIEKETNRVKLTDFGLARATDDIKLTKTGMVTGTPLYMSPEQAMGGTADERSDLFSLGALMYEMATGKSPFEAPTTVGVMKRIMDEMPEPAHTVNEQIPKPLSGIISKLLAKDPDDRPASASSVATALAGIVSDYGPISPLQVPAVTAQAAKRLSGDHRVVDRRWVIGAWAAGIVGVVSLAAAVLIWINGTGGGESSPESLHIPSIVLADNPGTVWSVDFSPNGKEVAAAIEDGTVRLWNIENQEVVKSFNAHRGIVWMVQFHPTRPIVMTCGDDGRISLWDRESFGPIKEWSVDKSVRSAAFSPDGSRLVAGDRAGRITIFDIDTGEEVVSQKQPGSIFGVDYSPNGELIATVGSDKVVRLWDATTLEERQTMSGHDGPIYNVKFASSGPLLATVGWNKNIRLWNVETGVEVRDIPGSEGDVWGVAFCGDSGHLVTGGQDGTARIWNSADGTLEATLSGHEAAVHNISLDEVNFRIATSSRDGTIRVWDLRELAEKEKANP